MRVRFILNKPARAFLPFATGGIQIPTATSSCGPYLIDLPTLHWGGGGTSFCDLEVRSNHSNYLNNFYTKTCCAGYLYLILRWA